MTEYAASRADDVSPRWAARLLPLICLLAVALRGYLAVTAVSISVDSALFIEFAQRLAVEPLDALRHYDQHPAYPALILAVHTCVAPFIADGNAGWILAGRLAAIAGSLAAVCGMYWFARRLYDRRCGLIAAAMLALLPDACRFGGSVLSDLPHLALYLFGMAALVAGCRKDRAILLPLAAGFSGLAFLTRPEGGAVLVIGVATVLLRSGRPVARRLMLAGVMLAVFFAIAGPYQIATGSLMHKKSLWELFGFGALIVSGTSGPAHLPHGFSSAASVPMPIELLYQWFRAGQVVYVVLAIIGLAVWRPRGIRARILGCAIGVHVLVLSALSMSYGYLDRRHALVLAALSLPLAAAGVWWLAWTFAGRAPARRVWRTRTIVVIVALSAICTGPWLLRPINAGEEHVVASAGWLRANTPADMLVVGDRRMHRVALHADRPFEDWAVFMRDKRAAYFVVDAAHIDDPARNPASFDRPNKLAQKLAGTIQLVRTEHTLPYARRGELRIYRYVPD
ncbi:MAG: glycosyltransferase family 39 protein [Planctomycetes bacterium]|nr:glycosyltransferase family 39 protein [Planctomycetota bacterium]